jgi:hypothetical protein
MLTLPSSPWASALALSFIHSLTLRSWVHSDRNRADSLWVFIRLVIQERDRWWLSLSQAIMSGSCNLLICRSSVRIPIRNTGNGVVQISKYCVLSLSLSHTHTYTHTHKDTNIHAYIHRDKEKGGEKERELLWALCLLTASLVLSGSRSECVLNAAGRDDLRLPSLHQWRRTTFPQCLSQLAPGYFNALSICIFRQLAQNWEPTLMALELSFLTSIPTGRVSCSCGLQRLWDSYLLLPAGLQGKDLQISAFLFPCSRWESGMWRKGLIVFISLTHSSSWDLAGQSWELQARDTVSGTYTHRHNANPTALRNPSRYDDPS